MRQYNIPNIHSGMRLTSPTVVLSTARKLFSMFRICLKDLLGPPTSKVYWRLTVKSPPITLWGAGLTENMRLQSPLILPNYSLIPDGNIYFKTK